MNKIILGLENRADQWTENSISQDGNITKLRKERIQSSRAYAKENPTRKVTHQFFSSVSVDKYRAWRSQAWEDSKYML